MKLRIIQLFGYFDPTHLLIPFNTIVDQLNRMFRWFTVSFFLISWYKQEMTKNKNRQRAATLFNSIQYVCFPHPTTLLNILKQLFICENNAQIHETRDDIHHGMKRITRWNSISVHGQLHVPVYMTDARYAPEMKLVPGWVSSRSLRQGWDPIPGWDEVTDVIMSIVALNSWHSI